MALPYWSSHPHWWGWGEIQSPEVYHFQWFPRKRQEWTLPDNFLPFSSCKMRLESSMLQSTREPSRVETTWKLYLCFPLLPTTPFPPFPFPSRRLVNVKEMEKYLDSTNRSNCGPHQTEGITSDLPQPWPRKLRGTEGRKDNKNTQRK